MIRPGAPNSEPNATGNSATRRVAIDAIDEPGRLAETFKEDRNNLRNEGSGQDRLEIGPFARANKRT